MKKIEELAEDSSNRADEMFLPGSIQKCVQQDKLR